MKINGEKISKNREYIVIPRPDGRVVFTAVPVSDMGEFDVMVPEPVAKTIRRPGKPAYKDVESQEYKDALANHNRLRVSWIILKSLEATEGLEWETVKMDDPSTWNNFESEMEESGLTRPEIQRVINGVMSANGLNQEKIDQAMEDFLSEVVLEEQPSE